MKTISALVSTLVLATLCAAGTSACSDSAAAKPDAGGPTVTDGGKPIDAAASFSSGEEITIPVAEKGRVFVKLSPLSVVAAPADPKASNGWDMAFEGYDITTNGGVSGRGKAAGFGPLDGIAFVAERAPTVPFLTSDKAAGAFLDWYAYEGAPSHALFSRYHVVGVKDGERLWKVQLLSYYGERDGAPISALYNLRYAELTAGGAGPTQEVKALDGTAGGAGGGVDQANELLELDKGARAKLTPEGALASTLWHLSFRRQNVGVNGGLGGPRAIVACDLDETLRKDETVDVVRTRTAESERARFDAVTRASFDGKAFRADRVVSAFGELWLDRAGPVPAPAYATWLVVDASGQKYLVGFSKFVSATTTSPGAVVMHRKPVSG